MRKPLEYGSKFLVINFLILDDMNNEETKIDTIREKFYGPLELAENCEKLLFYVSAILSLIIPLVDKLQYPKFYSISQIVFLLAVIILSMSSLVIRLYFAPRAQESRYKDFLSHAFNVPLNDEQTSGYYNNDLINPSRRIAAQTLENSFYSKNIILEMAKLERVKVAVYVLIWLVAIFNRNTTLSFIAIAAQLIFSEQLLSYWFRLEWLRIKFENSYDDLFKLLQSGAKKSSFDIGALEIMGKYEMAKANASVTLSSRIFNEKSEKLDKKWEKIRIKLGI